jgi:hypothetical protein
MLEIHDTLKNEHGWDIVALHEAVDELLDGCRLNYPFPGDDTWGSDRILYAEVVGTHGDILIGAGRLIWDSAQEDALPRITDLCLLRRYRNPFTIETIVSALIDEYAKHADGGAVVLGHDGREMDISERLERLRDIEMGQFEPRVI